MTKTTKIWMCGLALISASPLVGCFEDKKEPASNKSDPGTESEQTMEDDKVVDPNDTNPGDGNPGDKGIPGPCTSGIDTDFDGVSEWPQTHEYDGAGRLLSMGTEAGAEEEYEYDEAGRLQSVSYGGGVHWMNYEYDDTGRVARTVEPDMIVEYTYDAQGNVASKKDDQGADGNFDKTTAYTYDAQGRVVLTEVEHVSGTSSHTTSYESLEHGGTLEYSTKHLRYYGFAAFAEVFTWTEYDSEKRPLREWHRKEEDGPVFYYRYYHYDPAGNVLREDEFYGPELGYVRSLVYTYECFEVEPVQVSRLEDFEPMEREACDLTQVDWNAWLSTSDERCVLVGEDEAGNVIESCGDNDAWSTRDVDHVAYADTDGDGLVEAWIRMVETVTYDLGAAEEYSHLLVVARDAECNVLRHDVVSGGNLDLLQATPRTGGVDVTVEDSSWTTATLRYRWSGGKLELAEW